ncbi:hypothetical protein Tco_0884988, partial [Tanacetum coccineum]
MEPLFRRPLFNAPEFTWSIDYSTFGDGFHYFFYILRKVQKKTAAETDLDFSDILLESILLVGT